MTKYQKIDLNLSRQKVPFYMFLEKEYERYIRDAVRGWKLIMPYKETDVGGTFYIGIVSFTLGQPSFLYLCLFKLLHMHPLLLCHKLQGLEMDAESVAALLCHNLFDSPILFHQHLRPPLYLRGRPSVLLF